MNQNAATTLMSEAEYSLERVHLVDVAQPDEPQRSQHQNANARAEVAAVYRHSELEQNRPPNRVALCLRRDWAPQVGEPPEGALAKNSTVANRIRNGTSLENVLLLLQVNSTAPINPPTMLTGTKRQSKGFTGSRCLR